MHVELMMHSRAFNNLCAHVAAFKAQGQLLLLNCLINAICRNYLILLLSKPDRELLPCSHPPYVLLGRCCFAYTELRLPVRRLKGEHLTERKYSLCRFVILLVPLI